MNPTLPKKMTSGEEIRVFDDNQEKMAVTPLECSIAYLFRQNKLPPRILGIKF
jgi:hypothetical protein